MVGKGLLCEQVPLARIVSSSTRMDNGPVRSRTRAQVEARSWRAPDGREDDELEENSSMELCIAIYLGSMRTRKCHGFRNKMPSRL